MSYELTGRLHKKYETEKKTDSFQAREFVVEIDEDSKYPQFVKLQLAQDRCAIIDDYEEGDTVTVHFDLRGREWNEKYFTNLNAWKVEKAGTEAPAPEPAKATAPTTTEPEVDEDLPF